MNTQTIEPEPKAETITSPPTALYSPPTPDEDGFLTTEDGAVVGYVHDGEFRQEPSLIDDREAEAIARLVANCKARIVAATRLHKRAADRRAEIENEALRLLGENPEYVILLDSMTRAQRTVDRETRRLEFMQGGVYEALKSWAKNKVANLKRRYVDFEVGRVQLTKKTGKVRVADMEVFTARAAEFAPDVYAKVIKTECSVSGVAETFKNLDDDTLRSLGLVREPDAEKVDVVLAIEGGQ
jgi:hypothetical protein